MCGRDSFGCLHSASEFNNAVALPLLFCCQVPADLSVALATEPTQCVPATNWPSVRMRFSVVLESSRRWLMTSKNIAESESMLATECRHQAMQVGLLVSAVVGVLEVADRELQARLMARNCLLYTSPSPRDS